MDEHVLAQLIAAHSQYPQALRAIVEGLAVSDFRARPGEQGWSPLEILVHLRDEEIEDFRARAQAAASGSAIEREIDPQGWVTSRRYNDEDPERILDQLTAEREKSCAWLSPGACTTCCTCGSSRPPSPACKPTAWADSASATLARSRSGGASAPPACHASSSWTLRSFSSSFCFWSSATASFEL